jgi:hypothetical protein
VAQVRLADRAHPQTTIDTARPTNVGLWASSPSCSL